MKLNEKLIEFKKLADAIINPASEILPKTYDEELKAYWDWIDKNINQNKNEKNK